MLDLPSYPIVKLICAAIDLIVVLIPTQSFKLFFQKVGSR
jgi:hypothetical protein